MFPCLICFKRWLVEHADDPDVAAMLTDAKEMHEKRTEVELPDMDYTAFPVLQDALWTISVDEDAPHAHSLWLYDEDDHPRYVEDKFNGLPTADELLRFVTSRPSLL